MAKKTEPFSLARQMERLEEIDRAFRTPEMDLDAAFKQYEEAQGIAKGVQQYLDTAKHRLEELDAADLPGSPAPLPDDE
jgi:exodeoxyribonuclease VII small subunit